MGSIGNELIIRESDSVTSVEAEVASRFGILPNFFRLNPEIPQVTLNLWRLARFAYLDNPLPSLFKERLFVYLSRFCTARYCVSRHVGLLLGLGRAAGDSAAIPQTMDEVVQLLRRPLPWGNDFEQLLQQSDQPIRLPVMSDSPQEYLLFAAASHVFLQSEQSQAALEALKQALPSDSFQQLLLLLNFVGSAHFWTKTHPEIAIEDDIKELLAVT